MKKVLHGIAAFLVAFIAVFALTGSTANAAGGGASASSTAIAGETPSTTTVAKAPVGDDAHEGVRHATAAISVNAECVSGAPIAGLGTDFGISYAVRSDTPRFEELYGTTITLTVEINGYHFAWGSKPSMWFVEAGKTITVIVNAAYGNGAADEDDKFVASATAKHCEVLVPPVSAAPTTVTPTTVAPATTTAAPTTTTAAPAPTTIPVVLVPKLEPKPTVVPTTTVVGTPSTLPKTGAGGAVLFAPWGFAFTIVGFTLVRIDRRRKAA
jgi:hypothetical protein